MTKNIAILGTGANGSCIAADLIDAGIDVTLIDYWPEHVEAMRANGLRIQMIETDDLHVSVRAHHLTDVATFSEKFDIVLLVLKAYDTEWACHFIKPYLKPDGLLVGVQNGMVAEDIAEIVGPSRTLGCVVELGSELATPGFVERNTTRDETWFGVGSMDPSTEGREDEIVDLLRHTGNVDVVPDILSAKWMKLIVNTMIMTPIAILGLPTNEAIEVPGLRALMVRLGAESLLAGESLGHETIPIMGLTVEDIANRDTVPEVLMDELTARLRPGGLNTLLMDYRRGRKTEATLVNGIVADELERLGHDGSANAAVTAISERITRGELEPAITNLDLIQAMLPPE